MLIRQRSAFINVDLPTIPFPLLSTDTAGGGSGVYREWSFREVLRLLVDSGIYSGILFCWSRIELPWNQLYLEEYGTGSIFSGYRLHLILTWSRLGPDLVPTWRRALCVQPCLLSWCGEAPLDGLEILPRNKYGHHPSRRRAVASRSSEWLAQTGKKFTRSASNRQLNAPLLC